MRIGLLLLLAIYAALDVSAIAAWRTEAALWGHAYAVTPQSPRARSNHAKQLFAAGREAEARAVVAP